MRKKITFLLLILILIFFFCSLSGQEKKPKTPIIKSPMILKVDNNDFKKIGFLSVKDDESIGVKSIIIEDSVIYLVDAFHSNLKKLNIITGKFSSSLPLSENRAWLRDVGVFNKTLFVLSDLEINYILDLNLNMIKIFKLPIGQKYVYKAYNDSLLIYNMGKLISINKNGDILNTRTESVDILSRTHGKQFRIDNNIIETNYGRVCISSNFPYTWKKYYDAINIDFNDRRLVYYELNLNYLKIFIETMVSSDPALRDM